MKEAVPLWMLGGKKIKNKSVADLYLMPWLSHCGSDELGKTQTVNKFTGHFTESMPSHFMVS